MSDQGDLFRDPPGGPSGVPTEVCGLFDQLAVEVFSRGFPRYSARAILHRIRWHMHIERGNRGFKCNNNWTPSLSRWWLARHPEAADFFELRERVTDGEEIAE